MQVIDLEIAIVNNRNEFITRIIFVFVS